jgi:hypothetical protein
VIGLFERSRNVVSHLVLYLHFQCNLKLFLFQPTTVYSFFHNGTNFISSIRNVNEIGTYEYLRGTGISIYLLIGIFWAFIYSINATTNSGAFDAAINENSTIFLLFYNADNVRIW